MVMHPARMLQGAEGLNRGGQDGAVVAGMLRDRESGGMLVCQERARLRYVRRWALLTQMAFAISDILPSLSL